MKNSEKCAYPNECARWLDEKQSFEIRGLTKLEYFVCHSTFEPTKESIQIEADRDRIKNPHNDSYKPPLRSHEEIIAYLKIQRAQSLLDALEKQQP